MNRRPKACIRLVVLRESGMQRIARLGREPKTHVVLEKCQRDANRLACHRLAPDDALGCVRATCDDVLLHSNKRGVCI